MFHKQPAKLLIEIVINKKTCPQGQVFFMRKFLLLKYITDAKTAPIATETSAIAKFKRGLPV